VGRKNGDKFGLLWSKHRLGTDLLSGLVMILQLR
jgi:hypothetical protein